MSKAVENGIVINTSEIRRIYLDGITWHDDHFDAIVGWLTPDEDTTVITIPPTVPPTDPPTQPTTQPTNSPTTEPPSSAHSIILSFGLFIACLVLNL